MRSCPLAPPHPDRPGFCFCALAGKALSFSLFDLPSKTYVIESVVVEVPFDPSWSFSIILYRDFCYITFQGKSYLFRIAPFDVENPVQALPALKAPEAVSRSMVLFAATCTVTNSLAYPPSPRLQPSSATVFSSPRSSNASDPLYTRRAWKTNGMGSGTLRLLENTREYLHIMTERFSP